jgi:hypothetical protein
MHQSRLAMALLVIGSLTFTACGSTPPLESLGPVSPVATDRAMPSAPAPSAATIEPVPSDELADFTCDLPIVDGGRVAIANLIDVRIGGHDGYDRVVFEFEQGTPALTLDDARPPFTQDASGEPIDVDGTSFLQLTMRGGTKQTDAGDSSYDGPTDFQPGFGQLIHLVEGGDFERQSTWYLGLDHDACTRVTLLTDPNRVVIDVEQ